MKIAFDENMPAAMLRMFEGFHGERALRHLVSGAEIVRAQSYYPSQSDGDYSKKDDAPWIRRFAGDGGRVIISGDARMLQRPHEKLALLDCKMIAVFFPSPWSGWQLCKKASLLLHWWPTILGEVKSAKPGFYRVPKSWPIDGEMSLARIADSDLRMERIQKQKAMQPTVRKARRGKRLPAGTKDMFEGGTDGD